MSPTEPRLMVTGAGGHLGRRVVELLLDMKGHSVVAGSRDPRRLADLVHRGAEGRHVDFDRPDELVAAFAGVDRLLMISTDALTVPGLRLRQHKAAVRAAIEAGVKHVVYTSMPRPEPGSPIPFAPDHHATEQALEQSGLGWTILRNSRYADNIFAFLPQVLSSRKWYSAAGSGRVAMVARDDVAAAAAAVLASGDPANARYDITGPEALTTGDMARIASEVFGKPIAVIPVSDKQMAMGLAVARMPAAVIPLIVGMDAATRAGRADAVSDAVHRLTGRTPQSLRAFMVAHRARILGV